MAQIQLNKPLYETEDSKRFEEAKKHSSSKQKTPLEPRPGMIGRIGAFIVDILLLHAVLMLAVTFAHDYVILLGYMGRWLGLAIGIAYLTIGYSSFAGGRTLGKALLRLHVCDTAGADTTLGRAFARALSVMWPFIVYNILGLYSETADMTPEIIGWKINVWTVGAGLVASWGLSNLLFSALDPCGRSLYDYLCGTAQFCDASEIPNQQGLFRRIADQNLSTPPASRLVWAVIVITLLIPTLVGVILYRHEQELAKATPEDRQLLIEYRTAVQIPGFRFAGAGGRDVESRDQNTTASASDDETSVAAFLMVTRTKADVAALQTSQRVMDLPATQAAYFERSLKHSLAARPAPEAAKIRADLPTKMRFRIGFAELSDLFFAWNASEVFSLTKPVEFHFEDETSTTSTNHSSE